MTIQRKSVVDQIEVARDGTVSVRIALLLVEGGNELSSKWHRTSIPLDVPVAEQMAFVNQHLGEMGEALLPPEEIDKVVQFHALSTNLNAPE